MSDKNGDQVVRRLMESIYYGFGRIEAFDQMGEVHFREMRIKADNKASGGVLVIFKGEWDGLPVIGFHQDQGIVSAVAGGLNRATKGGLKWRIDEYAMKDAGYDNESIQAAGREVEGLQRKEG